MNVYFQLLRDRKVYLKEEEKEIFGALCEKDMSDEEATVVEGQKKFIRKTLSWRRSEEVNKLISVLDERLAAAVAIDATKQASAKFTRIAGTPSKRQKKSK